MGGYLMTYIPTKGIINNNFDFSKPVVSSSESVNLANESTGIFMELTIPAGYDDLQPFYCRVGYNCTSDGDRVSGHLVKNGERVSGNFGKNVDQYVIDNYANFIVFAKSGDKIGIYASAGYYNYNGSLNHLIIYEQLVR